MRKWIVPFGIIGFLLCLTACGGQGAGEVKEKEDKTDWEQETSTAEPERNENEILITIDLRGDLTTWYDFEDLGFAMKLPKDFVRDDEDGGDHNMVFHGKGRAMTIELCKWDHVSRPDVNSLAELVTEVTAEQVVVLVQNGLELVRVNWENGNVNYYFLDPQGDAYSLWITPYVMKEPLIYWQVRAIEESLRGNGSIPQGEEIMCVNGPEKDKMDYLILVNKKHALPEDWEENLDLVSTTNSVGDLVQAERTTYKAYLELKDELAKEDGIEVELDSGYRSVQYQQDILERFTEKYGAAYAASTVAKPGYSEHHTGLALDLYFRLDGEDVYYNEDLIKYPEIWKKIHARLADHGFILRYPGGESGTVDYTYEPWHIRYVGADAAQEIMDGSGITFEEWLEKHEN